MTDWKKEFRSDDIFFVTADMKRGLGFAGILPNYHIICSDFDPLISVLRRQGANIFCIEEDTSFNPRNISNSGKLLELPQVANYIRTHSKGIPKIMYFKPSLKLDFLMEKHGFLPIGNNSEINELFEDKINLIEFIKRHNLNEYIMPAYTGIFADLDFYNLQRVIGLPIVLQFGHGWAGKTTFFIKGEQEFKSLKAKFPHTKVKAAKFISGFTVLNNCCIYDDKVLISSPAVQIDGIQELGGKPGVTCGRQWPVKFLDSDQVIKIKNISKTIGNLMNVSGYKGYFGIDFLVENGTGNIYVSEVNARMTASSAFFNLLEIGLGTTPLLAYHMAQFLGKKLQVNNDSSNLIGSQIIIRKDLKAALTQREDYHSESLQENEYIFIKRNKTGLEDGDEFARIETKCEVLERPGKLNTKFQKIIGI